MLFSLVEFDLEFYMQKIIDLFSNGFDAFDLTISLKKTSVMFQPTLWKPYA